MWRAEDVDAVGSSSGLVCLGTSVCICEGQDARGFQAIMRRKLISRKHASCLPCTNANTNPPFLLFPPPPSCLFPI